MRFGSSMALVAVAWAGSTTIALAAGPVAVVEEVSGKPAGVEFMDYVDAGRVINLARDDTIVLGYLKSCWRETITGGTVTIGTEQSEVQSGQVERTRVKCDGGNTQLTSQLAAQSAGVISRNLIGKSSSRSMFGKSRRPDVAKPDLTIFARAPIFDVTGGAALLVERLDQQEDRIEISIENAGLLHGMFLDFARTERVLAAGGIYRATLGAKQIVFHVDPAATVTGPIVARLLRF